MKRRLLSLLFLVAAGVISLVSVALAEDPIPLTEPLHAYYTYGQLSGATNEQALRSSAAATTIPMWSYSVHASRDGSTRTGVMVGRSPFFHGARTTNIPTFIVPVKVHMPDGGVFDPGVADATCLSSKVPTTVYQNSPLFQTSDYFMDGSDMGTAQYIDAYQRANFFLENVSATGDRYHTVLSPVTVLAEQTFNVPANKGGTFTTGGCGNLGIMDVATFDAFVQGTLIPFVTAHGGGPTSFPIIHLYNVVMAAPFVPGTANNCCILGFHNAFGFPAQTYSIGDMDSTGAFSGVKDIAAPSHEIGEWMDDPLGNNFVPLWGHIGQQSGCQNNLENGDPLSGTLFPAVTLSSFTYHMQELAFFSWFMGTPSTGVDSDFSNNETFEADAGAICF
jgi:hypothetical protein